MTIQTGSGQRRHDHLTLKEGGFPTVEAALTAGTVAKAALRAAGVASDVAMMLGDDRASSRSSPYLKDKVLNEFGVALRDDVHGIDVFDEAGPPLQWMRMEAEGFATVPLDRFTSNLTENLESGSSELDPTISLAFELYMAVAFESTERARLIGLIMVLEVIATRRRRPEPAVAIVEEALGMLKRRKEELDGPSFSSLESALRDVREESISAALREMIDAVDTSDVDLGGIAAPKFLTDCYAIRSSLVHNGSIGEGTDLSELTGRLLRLTRAALLARLPHST